MSYVAFVETKHDAADGPARDGIERKMQHYWAAGSDLVAPRAIDLQDLRAPNATEPEYCSTLVTLLRSTPAG
jgi:hypothetical protein